MVTIFFFFAIVITLAEDTFLVCVYATWINIPYLGFQFQIVLNRLRHCLLILKEGNSLRSLVKPTNKIGSSKDRCVCIPDIICITIKIEI